MSLPTQPTETLIVTEALKKIGYSSPSSALITRASDEWFEAVKRDIMLVSKRWKLLAKTYPLALTVGVSKVQLPSDYLGFIDATLLDGATTGTATAGSTSSITLAAGDTNTLASVQGKLIVILSGTGANQVRQIQTYNPSTKVVTPADNFTTAPASGSVYRIIDSHYSLTGKQISLYDTILTPYQQARPTCAFYYPDDTEGDLYFDYVPDKTYGVLLRYFADLRKIDEADTIYTTLLRRWAGVFTQGVFTHGLQDDSRYMGERQIYSAMLADLKKEEGFSDGELSYDMRVDY